MSPTLRRLMKEAAELSESSPSPSPYFCAHPVSDENLFDWHFTISGPPAPSPYANGIYHGRIVLPPQYPLRPPSFRFLTPSGRFEVNREICLSISGHHEETWQPAWGIRTALIAIRSFMDADAKGQVGGLEAKEEARREWAEKSRGWTCDVCFGGKKTNEQILTQWREVCKRKGIVVDEYGGEREVVPEELRLEMKSEKEGRNDDDDGKKQVDSVNAAAAAVSSAESFAQSSSSNPNSSSSPATQQNAEQPSSSSTQHTNPSPSTTTTTPSPQTIVPEPAVQERLQPTRTVPTSTRQQVAVQSSDGPWLDRAIIGVVIALIFMILRKMTTMDAI